MSVRLQGRVPLSPVGLLGRSEDLDALDQRLAAGGRWLTLVGPPGVGKTRLAVEWATRWCAADIDRQAWYCDLAEVDDRDRALAALGVLLQVPARAADVEPSALLAAAFATAGTCTLVLDVGAGLLRDLADDLETWLQRADGLRLLVASRSRVRRAAETLYTLAPLAPDEAVTLLTRRAELEGYVASPGDEAALSAIAAQVDHLPLALEFAAGRLASLGVEAFRARRERGARDDAMAAVVSWSLEALSDADRSALRQLACFPSGFDVAAAEAVVQLRDPTSGVADVLVRLHDASLLRTWRGDHTGAHRIGLWASVADAVRRRDPDDQGAAARHRDHYAALASELRARAHRSDAVEPSRVLAEEHDNLELIVRRGLAADAERPDVIAGARSLVALEVVYRFAGPVGGFLTWIDAFADRLDAATHPVLASSLFRLRGQAGRRWGGRDARPALERALDLAREAGAAREQGLACSELALEAYERGDLVGACERHEQALTLLRAHGHRHDLAAALGLAALTFHDRGERERGLDTAREALALFEQTGDRRGVHVTLGQLGALYSDRGELDAATSLFEDARAALDSEPSTSLLPASARRAALMPRLARFYHELGRWDDALSCYEQAAALWQRLGDVAPRAVVLGFRATLLHEQGRLRAADRDYATAERTLRSLGARRSQALFAAARASLLAQLGSVGGAKRLAGVAVSLVREVADPALTEAVRLHGAHVNLLAAAPEDRSKHEGTAARLLHAVDAGPAHPNVRFAARLLRRSLGGAQGLDTRPTLPSEALVVGPEVAWIRPPGAPAVDLSRKPTLRRLVSALVTRRLEEPGTPLSTHALFEAGWPGEQATRESAALRVRVSLSKLRKLGLRAWMQRVEGGQRLDPEVPVVQLDRGDLPDR